MGETKVHTELDKETRAGFIRHLLDDIKALELMLENRLIESDITRIGSEQEFCLVTENWRPSKNAPEILREINDPHFTTELALYNLEINLDPVELKGDCFTKVETQLNTLLHKASTVAKKYNNKIILTGILPTISKRELDLDYMTTLPRYMALNNALREIRGSDFNLHISGVDELSVKHNTVMFEACNTSFQIHLQVSPDDFISSYNWAQAISGPILGICANSPLLLGRELWSETRIALFQQSVDTRKSSYALKEQQGRVSFGESWASGTVADLYKNEISRYSVILAKEIESSSLDDLENGIVPKLQALNLHNGTIYKWNRACYGVGGGKAHLRIENRYIPSGPSTIDEIANFALWVGLMMGRPKEFDSLPDKMDFRDAKLNFMKAATTGMESVLFWMGKSISVYELMVQELLPIAYKGLRLAGINEEDVNRLLGIVAQRLEGNNGTQWIVRNYRKQKQVMNQDNALISLTYSIYKNQIENKPVHEWTDIPIKPIENNTANLVGHIMSTQLFTVNENDLAELATSVMQWKNIHHVPVENNSGKLCGLLTWQHMTRFQNQEINEASSIVANIMETNIITASADTEIKKAIDLMKENNIGCLPVVQHNQLVGIITIKDLLKNGNG